MRYYDYLGQFLQVTVDPTLAVMEFFMAELGNPHKQFQSIHVAGTNGKGSVVETIASILDAGGYNVGKFISPYLTRFNEYISINSELVTDDEIEEYLGILKPIIDKAGDIGYQVKYFEIVTTLAYMHFAKHKVDIAVVEVGMGGTHDCTNVITPRASVITKIHFDHKEVLGASIEQIAGKKAGIIKQGIPVITSNYSSALSVIVKKAESLNAPLTRIMSKDVETHITKFSNPLRVTFRGTNYYTSLKGHHQGVNTALALCAVEKCGLRVTKEQIAAGLLKVTHNARFEALCKDPITIFDGAHNPDSIRVFIKMVGDYFDSVRQKKKVFIVSMLGKKDLDECMKEFASRMGRNSTVIFTSGTSDEFHKAQDLQKAYCKFDKKQKPLGNDETVRIKHSETKCMDFNDAVAFIKARPPDTIFFFVGSFKTYKTLKEVFT